MRALLITAAVAVGVPALFGAWLMLAIRSRKPALLAVVRHTNKHVFNRMQGSAGTADGSASLIHHRGRTSGKAYATPIQAYEADDAFAVTLPYSTHADWVKNILAAGSARLDHKGHRYELSAPEVRTLTGDEAFFPDGERATQRRFGVTEYLYADARPASDEAALTARADAPSRAV